MENVFPEENYDRKDFLKEKGNKQQRTEFKENIPLLSEVMKVETKRDNEKMSYEERVKENLKKIRKLPLVDRTVVHGRNNVPWKQEREDYIECDYQYINMMQHRKLNDIIDVNNGEKEFFTLWNSFLTSLPGVQGGLGFRSTPGPGVVRQFIRLRGTEILRKNLYRNLEIHLTVLREEGVLDTGELVQMIEEIQMVAAKEQLLGDIITNWEKQT